MEVVGVIVKHNCVPMSDRCGFTVEHTDGFDEGDVTGDGICGRRVWIDEPHGFGGAGRGEDIVSFDFGTVIKPHGGGLTIPVPDAADAGPEPEVSAERTEVADEFFQDQSDSLEGPAEAFLENAFKHDHELVEVHVARCGAAVEHQWAEEHINEQGLGDVFAENAAGGYGLSFEVECIVFSDASDKFSEAIDLSGEGCGNLFDEKVEVIGEVECAAREGD